MKRVLVTNLIMQRDAALFQPQLDAAGVGLEMYPVQQFLTEDELLPIIGDYDGMIAGDDQITRRVLEASRPRLKVISKWGVGLDSIDLDAAADLGVPVFNTPGAFGDAVGEVCVGYLVMLSRHLHTVDRGVRNGRWLKPEGVGLMGRTVGIVGFGAIGRGIAQRLAGFGCDVLATDVRMAEMAPVDGVSFADFDTVLAASDYLCLACNLTETNRRLIDAAAISRMKPGACVVNVARGPLVDETALIDALQTGRLGGAALDVYETEPLSVDNPLTRMDQVVLGSHNANNLRRANDEVNRNSIAQLLNVLADGP